MLRGGGQLHIVDVHDVVSIRDPDGLLHRLVTLADGSRNTCELFAALAVDYPQLEEQDVLDAVRELTDAGIVEDVAREPGRRDDMRDAG
jgi:hypothetical protein